MEYKLKNGKIVIIRKPDTEDAQAIMDVAIAADSETKFLAREPGEFNFTTEQEIQIIKEVLADTDQEWFVAEYDNKIVGQCSVGLVRRNPRFRHRAKASFVLLKEYWNLGIGGKMMEECIKWCKDNGILQLELEVVTNNDRAVKMYRDFDFEIIGTIENALRYQDNTYADLYLMVKKI